VKIISILLLGFAVLFFDGCAHTSHATYETKTLAPGIVYEKIQTKENQIAHVASIDPRQAEFKIIKAKGDSGLKRTSDLARAEKAILATNGGFFTKEGKAAGALKINGVWIKKPVARRGIMGWTETEQGLAIEFDRVLIENGSAYSVFHDHNWWDKFDNVIGGAPLILLDGKKISVLEEQTLPAFLSNRYARTAICKDAANNLKLVVFDGGDRKSNAIGFISGATIDELSDFLLGLGCIDALNLDGGYSSAFILNEQKANSYALPLVPERAVGDTLIVLAR
jgi:exopolysaccharide biosynthesis protein